MINTSFIHAYDNANKFEEQYLEDQNFFESQFSMLAYYDKKMDNIFLFEGADADTDETKVIQESVASVLSGIGKRVIDICERIKKFVKDQIDKVRNYFWDKKDLPTKLNAIAKKNPNAAAAEIKTLAASGKLDVDDIRVLSGCYKEIDSVIDELDKANRDPKSLHAKLDKIEDKFNSAKKVLLVGAEVAGAILTIGKLADIFSKHNPSKDKSLEDIESQARTTAKKLEIANDKLQDPKDSDYIGDCRSKLSVAAHAAAVLEKITNGSVSRRTRANLALGNVADKICKRAGKDSNSDHMNKVRSKVIDKNTKNAEYNRKLADDMAKEIEHSTVLKTPRKTQSTRTREYDVRTGDMTRNTTTSSSSSSREK